MRKIREVIRLKQDRLASEREIALACAIGRTTVQEYLNRAKAAGLSWPLPTAMSDSELERLLFPPKPARGEPPRPLPDWSHVQRELARSKGMTLLLLWQEYKRSFPDGYGYSRYASLYRAWLGASDVRMLQFHKAGEKLFVDWAGQMLKLTDPATGQILERPVFVSAMGMSQRIFARTYESQDLRSWLCAHSDALEFYGALPEAIVPDNPKTAALKACRYEPVLNPAYAEWAQFYSVAVVPARVRKPRDKAKVENAVQQVERWVLAPLRDRTFFGLEEANAAIAEGIHWLNARTMKAAGASREQLFEEEDRPAMRKLPSGRYSFADWKRAKVGPDYHVEFERRLYSVPFGLVGKHVDIRAGAGTLEVFLGGKRVASHLRCIGRRPSTDPSHMPEGHRRHAEWTPERIVRWAAESGPLAGRFIEAMLAARVHPEQAFRSCLGVIRLGESHGRDRLERACAKALELGAFSYRSLKSILDKNLEEAPPQEPLPSMGEHGNIRGGDYYDGRQDRCAS
jgi:transposase